MIPIVRASTSAAGLPPATASAAIATASAGSAPVRVERELKTRMTVDGRKLRVESSGGSGAKAGTIGLTEVRRNVE